MVGGPDMYHLHSTFVQECDIDPVLFQCRNDGFWQISPNNGAYGYVLNPAVTNYDGSAGHLLDPYLTLAKEYGWANYMYQTNQGPSYPSHLFLFAGTSALTNQDDADSIFVSENNGSADGSGCIMQDATAKTHAWNRIIQPVNGSGLDCFFSDANSVQECLVYNNNAETYCTNPNNMATTVLDPNSISWKYYAPSPGTIWTAPNAIQSICQPELNKAGQLYCTGEEWAAKVDVANHGTDILRDIADCRLAQVSWVMPDGAWSDHAGPKVGLVPYGPSWVAAIINAIGNNPTCAAGTPDAGQKYWDNTVIVVTWDDWGGWADNQPPKLLGGLPCIFTTPATPCPGDYQYGYRVPLLVVSAYTPRGVISNSLHDYGSILRMIEGINHLPEGMMGNADARATNDLRVFFSAHQPPRPYLTVVGVVDAKYFTSYVGTAIEPDDD
jgi:phospholipase C